MTQSKSNGNNSSMEQLKSVSVLGGSILKKLDGYLLSKRSNINTLQNFNHFQVLK